MTNQYSVDYWINPEGQGDPNRSDYSDDLPALRRAALSQRRFDGQSFAKHQFYEMVANITGEMRNWKPIP